MLLLLIVTSLLLQEQDELESELAPDLQGLHAGFFIPDAAKLDPLQQALLLLEERDAVAAARLLEHHMGVVAMPGSVGVQHEAMRDETSSPE
jgi:hypothetical protein